MQGQVEYEMPLLAPPPSTATRVKGRRSSNNQLHLEDETPELPGGEAERPEFVHIATKRR